ncbi:hypothetical protein O0I10_006485 [Lichtheimia ornata]|uniref:Alginate lyase domain-containing protein n=1 Tax=Lichtheimia ornata TaxID=688661 RepID=A0AAD7V2K5_9FUNG|nr:uncharacterized protein O0I10_006485 [Lichtheimia ornata]KAJ8657670.1 hypothetical protein O0I10_006485 [Lichtheimia ornata]
MRPPSFSNGLDTRFPPASGNPQSPSSPVNRSYNDYYNAKQRRMNNPMGNHLGTDIAVDLGSPARRRPLSSFWSVKDKPRRFFQPHRYRYYHRNRWWLRPLLVILFLALVFGYIPFFHLSLPNPTTSSNVQSTSSQYRDQLLLYRIIGNDLPPRHKEGQTLSNLRFILEHEPSFPNTRKIFVLNRITDPVNERAIIQLLERYNAEYLNIAFNETEYQRIDFRLEDFPEPDFLHSDDYRRFSKVAKLRALDYTYHDKNLYAMNNNGGRNTALAHGRSIGNAKWIMPFDGNCYLSQNAFDEIKTQLDRFGDDTKYFVVPMTRLLNNSDLLNSMDERPRSHEEPQIIFRFDAEEEYNLNMRYGRRSKLELLWRLGALENRKLNRPTVAWEPKERAYSKDKGNFRFIGWVFRLFSGNQAQEESKKEASSIRAFNRLLAIQSTLDALDERIARHTFRHDRLFLYNETELAHIRHRFWSEDSSILSSMTIFQQRVDDVLLHTREQLAPMAATDDVDHILDAGMSINSEHHPGINPPALDTLGSLTRNITTLALGNYLLGNEKYGRWAANLIRVYFLSERALGDQQSEYSTARMTSENTHLFEFLSDQGYSFPSLNRVSHVMPKYTDSKLISTIDLSKTDLTLLLDAMRLLRRAQMLSHKEYAELQTMMAQVLEYLVAVPTGIHLAQMTDHRGVLYDLQVTALAAFTDDVRFLLRVANRCRMRIGKQFLKDGSQPYQDISAHARLNGRQVDQSTEDAILFHYRSLNLQYWTILARGIQNSGVANDIWHYTANNQGRISHAVVHHLQQYSPFANDQEKQQRLALLTRLAYSAFTYSNAFEDDVTRQSTQQDLDWIDNYQKTRDESMGILAYLFI